ncbi:adenylate/guanylate cyclase domain-containing protein [Sulfuricystis multivorans]|uniref:adenylate/guanylate cyclase domain-containing protein n=1 Tax=Sulfuricystis multivorans TaxID=2211108 RepID=UPI000F8301E3|nr:adenylate/guanylate cyclase domain-containing protein [Sulfuricystis multivorans]
MSSVLTVASSPGFLERLRNAGVEPGDSPELALNKQLLFFATGLVSITSMLWVAIYWALGPQFSVTLPYLFQLTLAGNLVLYIYSRNFEFFRFTQLTLFLFAPFAMQWGIGNFITGSGIILWGLLAPFGAILCYGVRESIVWFLAWILFTALTGVVDFLLVDGYAPQKLVIPLRTSMVFFALNFIAVASIIYVLLRYSIEEKRKIQERLEEAHRQLLEAQYRSEKLLLNILPAPIAERLKQGEKIIADRFPDATVIFADLVDFTLIASHMSPDQVFGMLNEIFSAFDDLCARFGLEKIKTIGDAYMAAGGLIQSANDPAGACADFALAMQALLRHDHRIDGGHMALRIGISSGTVVAGVVGKHKFIYDIWGDKVNLASRLTDEALPGSIYCDAATYEHLAARYDFAAAQRLHLKGLGEVAVYPLIGRKTSS